jgi:tRNA G18 (ribose-2'-O)-methylase SpoU
MRGYFAIGVEGISKAMNVGSLMRSAHAFGASFLFTVAAAYPRGQARNSDTSDAEGHVPLYVYADVESLMLPRNCALVGVELADDAIELPSFHHPRCAAYVFGPERGSLSAAMTARCHHLVHIPTRFSLNVGIAGAIVMYDRLTSLGRFAPRPVRAGGPTAPLPPHVFGRPTFRRASTRAADAPPAAGPTGEHDGPE